MNPKPLPPHQPNSAQPNNVPPAEVAAAAPGGGRRSARSSSRAPSRPRTNKNPHGKVFSLPESEIEDGSVEAGLLCLSYWAAEHPDCGRLSRAEIAHVCGCSESLIVTIEQRALRRIHLLHAEFLRKHPDEDEGTHPEVPVAPQMRNHP